MSEQPPKPTLCGFPIVFTDRPATLGVKGPVVMGSLDEDLARIRERFLADQAELLDARFSGDEARIATAQAKMDQWEAWARSLPDEEE